MSLHNQYLEVEIGPVASVTGAGKWYRSVGMSGTKWLVESAVLTPDAAQTANGTNYATYTLRNETQSLDVASRSYAATNSVAGTAETLTPTAGLNSVVNGGDTLSWAKADSGTGLAGTNRVRVTLKRIV